MDARFEAPARLLGVKTPPSARPNEKMPEPAIIEDALLSLTRMIRRVEHRSMAPAVLPLGAVDDDDRALVGGKFSKLGEILSVVREQGAYVPESLSVTTEGYSRFLEENGLTERIKTLADDLDRAQAHAKTAEERQQKVSEVSHKIRELIKSGKLNPDSGLGAEIWNGMQAHELAGTEKHLAIRSSAVQEDQADSAFAGAAETYLNISPEEALVKIVENWASFWLPRGIAYRHGRGIASADLRPSTIVQKMAEADVAGVIFTRNPVSGADEIVINAAYGLGEGVVSGIVTNDRYVTRKSDGQETQLPFVGDKRIAVMPNTDGSNTEIQGIEKAKRHRRSLTLAQTQRLSLIAKALERRFGYSLDIEFAIKEGRVAILQARPVTSHGTQPVQVARQSRAGSTPVKGPLETLDSAEPAVVYKMALKRWKQGYNSDYLLEVLRGLEAGDREHLDSAYKPTLKTMRKDASRLRGVFQMFDARHAAPGEFGRFVVMFGDLNDAIDDEKEEEARRQATNLRAWIARHRFEDDVSDFKPADRRSVSDYMARSAKLIRASIDKDKLSDEEFHDARKKLKNFMYLLSLLSDLSPKDSALRERYDELTRLNREMGELRDSKRHSGDEGHAFPMPPEIRRHIVKFLDFFHSA